MDIKTMQKIVDGAPEWAKYWITQGEYHHSVLSFPNMSNHSSYGLDELRTELAKREPMDLRDVDIPHGTIVLEK